MSAEIDRYIANCCITGRKRGMINMKMEGIRAHGVVAVVVLVANVKGGTVSQDERHSSILPKKASSSSSARPRLRELTWRKSSSSAKLSSSMSTSLSLW